MFQAGKGNTVLLQGNTLGQGMLNTQALLDPRAFLWDMAGRNPGPTRVDMIPWRIQRTGPLGSPSSCQGRSLHTRMR